MKECSSSRTSYRVLRTRLSKELLMRGTRGIVLPFESMNLFFWQVMGREYLLMESVAIKNPLR